MRKIALSLVWACLPVVCFAQPEIDRVDQSAGGTRGTEFEVLVEGLNLEAVDNVLFFDDGLMLRSIVKQENDRLQLKIKAADDCRLGEHPFTVTGPQGSASPRSLHITPFNVLTEHEPNSKKSTAQSLELPITVTGIIDETDEDWFRVNLKAGQRLTAEAVALPLGRYLFDALLEVFDEKGKRLFISDDTPLLRQDPLISFTAKSAGDYYVRIREAAFGGDLDSRYRLHLGHHARPVVAYPAGVPANEPTTVKLLGDSQGQIEKQLVLHEADQTHEVNISPGQSVPGSVRIRCSDSANVLELEPNNSPDAATPAPRTSRGLPSLNGILSRPGDIDFFSFDAKQGEAIEISVFAAQIGSPVDSLITVFNVAGETISQNDDGIVHDSKLRFVPPTSGEYKVSIRDQLGRGSATSVYRIEFRSLEPRLQLQIPSSDENTLPTLIVPRGAHVPLLLGCRRQNYVDEVKLSAVQLPSGVSCEPSIIESGNHLGMAMFHATEQAALGAKLISMRGESDTSQTKVYGELLQNVGLVFGQPRKSIYHSIDFSQFPIIVTEKSPFSISVVEPQAPLVQQGKLGIKVAIARDDGFADDITLSLAYAPPWIRGPEEPVVAAEGESVIEFPLEADPEADARNWKIAIVGTARTPRGLIRIACEPFRISVARPYLNLSINRMVSPTSSDAVIKCQLEWEQTAELAGEATLRGLPKDCEVSPQTVRPGQEMIEFPLRIGKDAPPAVHNTLFVELVIPEKGENVTHFLGQGGTLELLEPGAVAQQQRSRLEILREAKRNAK